jgi:hypothetical protein
MKRILSLIVIAALMGSATGVSAQSVGTSIPRSADYWLRYTEKLQVGSTIRVRTSDGKRMTAVLAFVDETGITVEPKTRVPESPRHISFDQLQQVELNQNGRSVGKSVAIGVATGVGTFLGILLILAASWD